jgi:hypothetical protein
MKRLELKPLRDAPCPISFGRRGDRMSGTARTPTNLCHPEQRISAVIQSEPRRTGTSRRTFGCFCSCLSRTSPNHDLGCPIQALLGWDSTNLSNKNRVSSRAKRSSAEPRDLLLLFVLAPYAPAFTSLFPVPQFSTPYSLPLHIARKLPASRQKTDPNSG